VASRRWHAGSGAAGGGEDPLAGTEITQAAEFAEVAWEPHAEFVEVPGSDDSMIVYLDEPSGWLVVWAVDPTDGVGG
jgi:hypothetical protein